MSARERLPDRRKSEVICFEVGGVAYRAQVSRFKDGRLAEVFFDGPKIGSSAQIAAHDAAVATSLGLQNGVSAETLHHALQKQANGRGAGPIGILLDELVNDG